jgi:hypothetical protein
MGKPRSTVVDYSIKLKTTLRRKEHGITKTGWKVMGGPQN